MRGVEAGKRYRISREVEVTTVETVGGATWVSESGGLLLIAERYEWEELEPKYEQGGYYIDAEGDVYQRRADEAWPWRGGSTNWEEDVPLRPLRKLDLP